MAECLRILPITKAIHNAGKVLNMNIVAINKNPLLRIMIRYSSAIHLLEQVINLSYIQ